MPNIIAGKYKRTKIEVPSKLVRPTSALKREAIFSILESYSMQHSINIYKDKSIIDIFAGSGLIGLEAVSRGIKKSYFIEDAESVFKILKRNCDKICKLNEYEIIFKKAEIGIDREFDVEPSIIFSLNNNNDIGSFIDRINDGDSGIHNKIGEAKSSAPDEEIIVNVNNSDEE